MVLFIYNGNVGSGKTSIMVSNVLDYINQNSNNKIYANHHYYDNFSISDKLLKNIIYTPYSFISETEKENIMIVIDDYSTTDNNLDVIIKDVANKSRKLNIEVLLSAQDYTMILPKVRRLATYIIYPFLYFYDNNWKLISDYKWKFLAKNDKYFQFNTIHHLEFYTENEKYIRQLHFTKNFKNIIKKVMNHYDTYEIVKSVNQNDLVKEIVKHCKTFNDIELYTNAYFKNKALRVKVIKKICEIKKIVIPKTFIF